jgi:Skp family chaperone for outer membrane proteins
MKILRTMILTVSFLAFLSVPALAQTRIATVDLRKLFDGYWKTKQAQVSIQERAAQLDKDDKGMRDDLKKASDEYQQLLEQANDQAISSDERTKRQQAADAKLKELQGSKAAMTQFESEAQNRLADQRQQMRADILKEIQTAITAKAQAAGYSLVLDAAAETVNGTPAVLYNNNDSDLTDAVLAQLNAGAPVNLPTLATPAATNSP